MSWDTDNWVDPKALTPGLGRAGNAFYHLEDGGLVKIFMGDPRLLQRQDEQWICWKCAKTWYRDSMMRLPERERALRFGHLAEKDEKTYILMEGIKEGKLVHALVWYMARDIHEKAGWKVARVTEWP